MLAPPNDVGLPVFSVFAAAKHHSRSVIIAEGTSFCRQANLIRVSSCETHDGLNVPRSGEHIHRGDRARGVAERKEKLGVAGEGLGITAYVDHAPR